MPESEIACLRHQIDLEYEAAERALHGYAIAARHDFINTRMEQVWEHVQEIERVGGREAAKEVLLQLPPIGQQKET